MTWQPPEPMVTVHRAYTLDQLLTVRRETLEQCAELCELFDATHPHGLAAEFRKMKELT